VTKPKESSTPAVPLSTEQQAFAAGTKALYKRAQGTTSKPQESQLEDSGLFKSFGAAAIVQGVEEDTPRLFLDPAQTASLKDTLRAQEPWKL
jgi:hypothetical protein